MLLLSGKAKESMAAVIIGTVATSILRVNDLEWGIKVNIAANNRPQGRVVPIHLAIIVHNTIFHTSLEQQTHSLMATRNVKHAYLYTMI